MTPSKSTTMASASSNGQAVAPLLSSTGIDVHYGRVQVLYDVSIDVMPGEFVTLLGTNGAGKSTWLKAVSNLVPVSRGQVMFEGEDITTRPPDEIVGLGLGHVPGGRGTLPDLTVHENLRLGGHLLRHRRRDRDEGIAAVLDLFPWMHDRRSQLAGTLSGGEQQMLAIGRALVSKPRLLMVDELSLGLAPIIVEELLALLARLHGEGLTVLVVEQNATLALEVAERALFLEKGRVRFAGQSSELLGRDDLLRSVFLGGALP
jgi:branched-chain amino acid transport system ATP-binding protein